MVRSLCSLTHSRTRYPLISLRPAPCQKHASSSSASPQWPASFLSPLATCCLSRSPPPYPRPPRPPSFLPPSAALPPPAFVSLPRTLRPPHVPGAPAPLASFLPLVASPPLPPIASTWPPPPPISGAQPPEQPTTPPLSASVPGRLLIVLGSFARTEFQILATT